MPIRKKIYQILRSISGRNQRSEPVQKSASLEPLIVTDSISSPENTESLDWRPSPDKSSSETTAELVLYGRSSCPYCARVDRVIEELGIEDKITRRLTTYGSEWRTDLRERTGRTQVPCLFIDGEAMFESLDIIDWMRSNFA